MKTRLLVVLMGTLLLLGLPPVLMLTKEYVPPEPLLSGEAAVAEQPAHPSDLVKPLLPAFSTLEGLYRDWETRYIQAGGDRNVVIALGWTEGLSTEYSKAPGRAYLDLIGGSITVQVKGLQQAGDVWLVDNQEGPGRSVKPEPGDRMVRIGRLTKNGLVTEVSASVGEEFFRNFELDLVVVSPAGKTPAESRILLGTRPFFERHYTRTRLAAEQIRTKAAHPTLASLMNLLRPRFAEADSTQVLIAHGLVSKAVGEGADLFFREKFDGNSRTCATCHRAANNLGLDVEFISTLPDDDPLFVAEFPPEEGGVPGLERPALMRSFALILENVDGLEDPTVKFTMRGVPHSLSMATSILAPDDGRAPVERTGWSGDGAPQTGALRFFPVGAVIQHFPKSLDRIEGTDFRLPTDTELDKMEAFMLATGRLNELDLTTVDLKDTGAAQGLRLFNNGSDTTIGAGQCFRCHFNAGANVSAGTNNNFDTGVETVVHDARLTVEDFPFDGGFGTADRDCDGDGVNDCFGDGTFNTPPLIETADTEPFFHNNVDATVEDSVRFYVEPEFQNSPSGQFLASIGASVNLTPEEVDDVSAFLRVLNAAFNVSIAIQRNEAALTLENSSSSSDTLTSCGGGEIGANCGGGDDSGKRATVNALLTLSNVESSDAIDVLNARSLHADAVKLLVSAIDKNNAAISETSSLKRKRLIKSALNDLQSAKEKFGTGLDFTLGEGNLLF